jgi:hypothetical protein
MSPSVVAAASTPKTFPCLFGRDHRTVTCFPWSLPSRGPTCPLVHSYGSAITHRSRDSGSGRRHGTPEDMEETTMKSRRDPEAPRPALALVCRTAVTTALVRVSGSGGRLGLPASGGCDALTAQLDVVGLQPPAEPSTWPGPTKNTVRSTSASSRDVGGSTGRESKAAAATLAFVRRHSWKIARYLMLVVRPLRMWATKTGYRGRHRLNLTFDQ